MRPLKIAYRGNWVVPYTTESHVTDALTALGHTVIRLQEDKTSWADTESAARDADMFLWQRTWHLDLDGGHACLAHLRDVGIPTVTFHLDLYLSLPEREAQVATDPFWKTAFVFTADGGHDDEFAAYGVNHWWLPPAVAAEQCVVGRPDRRRFPHPVVFVGSHPYPHPTWRPYRDELIATLERRYGREFAVWPQRGRPIRLRDLASLYASCEVVVGDSCHAGQIPLYWSDRTPEALARGAFLIHPEVPRMDEWYRDGEHFATYPVGDFAGLVERIDYFRAHPEQRARVAAYGRETVMARDTYKHRMSTVLETVESEHGFPPARTPRPAPPKAAGTILARSAKHRLRATFTLAEGDTDRIAVEEVWRDDTYRVERADIAGKVVVDIGANVGAFTVLAAKLGARRVYAYEPHPANRACLEQNVAANGVADRVGVHPEAVTDKTGATVHLAGTGGGVHLAGEGIEVSTISLADVLTEVGDPVALLKLDAEGAEWLAFESVTASVLHDHVKRIALEWHGPLMGPHCAHLDDDGGYIGRWHRLVEMLADSGWVEVRGHPTVGGLMYWRAH